jgi:hypothetical protein
MAGPLHVYISLAISLYTVIRFMDGVDVGSGFSFILVGPVGSISEPTTPGDCYRKPNDAAPIGS